MKEEFRKIKNFDHYSISNLGRVYSHKSKKFLKPFLTIIENPQSYLKVRLSQNHVIKTFYIHRLVAAAFVSNPNQYNTVNHKDCDKHNNKADNLEFMSNRQNTYHAFTKGLIKIKQPQAVKNIEDNLYFYSLNEAARYYGISHQTICNRLRKQAIDDTYYTPFLRISNEELIYEIVNNPEKFSSIIAQK